MGIRDWILREFDFNISEGENSRQSIDFSGSMELIKTETILQYLFHIFSINFIQFPAFIQFQLYPVGDINQDAGYHFIYETNNLGVLTIRLVKDNTVSLAQYPINITTNTWLRFQNEYNRGIDYTIGELITENWLVRDGNRNIILKVKDIVYENSNKKLIIRSQFNVKIDNIEVWSL